MKTRLAVKNHLRQTARSIERDTVDLLSLLIGALLGAVMGVGATVAFEALKRKIKRRKPLCIEVIRSKTPPLWFATNEAPPDNLDEAHAYEEMIVEDAAFCGFAKINLKVTNTTDEVTYITDIQISKKPVIAEYRVRVRTIPQGGLSAIRLVACLDDDHCFMSCDLSKRYSKNGNYFECGERIKIAPGETEYIFLSFVTVNQAWEFNCCLTYSIHGSTRRIPKVLGNNLIIVPYLPEKFELDYCAFLERVDPGYKRFDDADYFTAAMRRLDPADARLPLSSSLAYLESEIE